LIREQRRQRIFAAARRLEDVPAVDFPAAEIAGFARHAKLVFGAIVKGFQVRVRQRPVRDRGVLRNGGHTVSFDGLRTRAEIVLVQSP
jgi:hypothetical protein